MDAVSVVMLAIAEGVTALLVEGGATHIAIEEALVVGGTTVAQPMPRLGNQPTRMMSNHDWCSRGDNTKYMAKK